MADRQGYDVVVDVDAEGDLGHTDLNDDLEFHTSTFNNPSAPSRQKAPTQTPFLSQQQPATGGPSASSKRYLWSLAYYQQFFDIDTNQILTRCMSTLYPRSNFLDVLDGNPDLYGPFWIATTVVVILFLTGTISSYLASEGKDHFAYDFKLLSGAAGLIYGYTLVVPVGLWAVLKWFGRDRGMGESGGGVVGVVEVLCLYGYANLIWIPVALVSWSPYGILNYTFTAVGLAVSAFFLVRNLYPVVSATDQKTSRILLIVVLVLHAGLAIAIKILFFAHGSVAASKPKTGAPDPMGDAGKGEKAGDAARLLFGL